MKRSSNSSNDRGDVGGGASQVEGTYDIIWDYFGDSRVDTDGEVERVDESGEKEEEWEVNELQWNGEKFYEDDNYQQNGFRSRHIAPASVSGFVAVLPDLGWRFSLKQFLTLLGKS